MADPRHTAGTFPKLLALQVALRGDKPFLLLPKVRMTMMTRLPGVAHPYCIPELPSFFVSVSVL